MIRTTALRARTIYTPTEAIEDGVVVIEGPQVTAVGRRDQIQVPTGAEIVEFRQEILAPGFIDLHIHGAGGRDLMEASEEAVTVVASYLARHGTTSFLATTITASLERTLQAAQGLGRIIRRWESTGPAAGPPPPAVAQPVGIHFEGPFLNAVRRGAHPLENIQKPSVESLKQMLEAAEGTARVITMAPEVEGALEVLGTARQSGVRVAIGHSDATFEEAERAIVAGATHVTHAFNAMRPFLHRDPGILGAALTDDRLSAELICDGVHVAGPAVRLLVKTKGLGRVLLVTDCLSGAGMPDGEYNLGEFTIRVAEGACRTLGGTLAGSTLTLDRALMNLSQVTGLSWPQCLPCATLNPARLLGLEKQKGMLAPGADADLVVLDAKHQVVQTYVRGRPVNRVIESLSD